MNRIRVPSILLSALALLSSFSCSAKRPTTDVQPAIERSGIVIWQGAPFYVDAGSKEYPTVEWKAALDFGTAVKRAEKTEQRSLTVGGQSLAIIQVEVPAGAYLPAKEPSGPVIGWIRADHFAGGGAEPAVVTGAQASLFKEPSEKGPVIATLPRLSLLAIVRKADSVDFARAVAMDPVSQTAHPPGYMDLREVSVSRDDVRAAILVAKAAAARKPGERKALLEDAERSFPDTAFLEDVRAMLGRGKRAEGPSTEPLAASLAAKRDGVKIRGAPSGDAETVATLNQDDEVKTVSRTIETHEVDGKSAHWYEVETPAHGWVFGMDLEGAD